jgi:hypothetical protein
VIFYLANGQTLCGTQAEAKAIDRDFVQIDIPTDKPSLMAFVQNLYDQAGQSEVLAQPDLPVAITFDEGESITVVHRTATVAEAEEWIATGLAEGFLGKEDVEQGRYGIDAPEEMVNPEPTIIPVPHTAQLVAFEDEWESFPLARKAHFAALFCEEARLEIK